VFAFGPWNLVLVCVSAAIAVVAKSAKEANVASNMGLIVLIFDFSLLSINFDVSGFNPDICNFESLAAGEPYNPAASGASEGWR
jgi:hypothetical protein